MLWLALAASLAACAPAAGAPDSGVEGLALIGPMCPVMAAGQHCPDQPYQAEIEILDSLGRRVARVQSDPQGRFRAALAPGSYLLRPLSPASGGLPHAPEQSFTVAAGQFISLTILYDSGIR